MVFKELFQEAEARNQFNKILEIYGRPRLNDDDIIDQIVLAELEGAINDKKKQALRDVGLDLDLEFRWDFRGVNIDDFLKELGLESTLDCLDSAPEGLITLLEAKLDSLRESLRGHANVDNSIRLSRLKRTISRNEDLVKSGRYVFDQTPVDVSHVKAGVAFYRSGEAVGDYAADCHDGVILTPLGVFNVLVGKVTHEFPRGRVMVPFKGFMKEGNVLASQGTPVEHILDHVVVLKSPHFHSVRRNADPYTKVFVYDGEKRVREIHFNHETYEVIEDRIVRENVRSMDDVPAEYSKE